MASTYPIMKWLKKIVIKMAWPKVKKMALEYVQSDEYQKKYTEAINKKLDIPNVSEESEAKLLNQVYDAGQEVIVEFIEGIDIESLADKIG